MVCTRFMEDKAYVHTTALGYTPERRSPLVIGEEERSLSVRRLFGSYSKPRKHDNLYRAARSWVLLFLIPESRSCLGLL